MLRGFVGAALAALVLAQPVRAEEQEFVAGDGTRFALPTTDGMPGRAEHELVVFEAAGFDIATTGTLSLTDRFTFLFRGGERPTRVRIEDITLPTPVLIAEAVVPEDLEAAGFRRARFQLQASPCAIARGEPCSAWMFGPQSHRLYRATLVYAERDPVVLLQAEPFQMASFVARLGDRIPDRSGEAEAKTAQSQQP